LPRTRQAPAPSQPTSIASASSFPARELGGRHLHSLARTGRGQRQRQPEPRAALAVPASRDFDSAALRKRVFARDRKTEPRTLDAAVYRRRSLVERVEDA